MDTYDTKLPRSRSAEHMRPAPSIASMRPDAMVQLQWNINKSRVRPSYKESKTMSEKKRNEEKSKSVRPFTIYTALDYLQHDAQSWILVFCSPLRVEESACGRGASTTSPITDDRAIGLHEACIWIMILIPNMKTLLFWIHCSKMTANGHHQWVQTVPDRSKSCYSYIVPSDKSI